MPSPTPEAWAQIRYDYEHTDRPINDICFEHGITANTLRDRRRRWGWTQRRIAIPAEGPPAVAIPQAPRPVIMPQIDVFMTETPPLGPRLRGDERSESEPSPHIVEAPPVTATPDDTRPLGERLHGAVARVMPAIETTLATLAAGPARPREMELAARALGSLMRTLRELNGLLTQYPAQPAGNDLPAENIDDMRNELARMIEAMVASERDAIPARYEAGWNEFFAEAKGHGAASNAPPSFEARHVA